MKKFKNSRVIAIGLAILGVCFFSLLPSVFAQQSCEVITVFPLGDTWSYDDTGAGHTGQAWTALSFDDSGWSSGTAPFGFGDPWVVTEVAIEKGTYYFRKKFDFSGDASEIKALVLRALFDDGMIVYLNGTEIVRREMPIGPITPDQFGYEHEVRNPLGEFLDLINPDSSVTIVDKLLSGDNIMAVEVHNVSLTSSDAGFDAGLWYSNDLEIVAPLPLGSTWRRDNTFSDLGTAWREIGYDDSAWLEECAPIGIEDDLPNPVCTELPTTSLNGYYFRTTFTIEHDLSLIDSLFVIAQYDDGIEIFINGQRLLRGFLGIGLEGEVTWDTFAAFHDSHPRQVFNVSDQKNLFVKGENLMALTVKQDRITSSDIYMDVGVSYRLCEMSTSAQWESFQVAASTDDAEEHLDTNNGDAIGEIDLSSTDLELGFESGVADQLVGIRFTGLTIAQGAKIDSAYIQFTVDDDNTGATSVTIRAEDTDNSATFTADAFNISSRSTTILSQDWSNIPAWSTIGESGVDQQTPDISALIQAVIDRPGYALGNPITLIISGTGEREAESWDGNPAAAPELFIKAVITATSVEDEGANVPIDFALSQNYPNPFNPSTTIQINIAANHPINQNISVEIFDLLGRKVRTLFSGTHAPGTLYLNWDATDEKGSAVSSGIYVYRLHSGGTKISKKLLLTR